MGRIKIISDGTGLGTHIIDLDTKEDLTKKLPVDSVKIFVGKDDLVCATITLVDVRLEVEADGEIDYGYPTLGGAL